MCVYILTSGRAWLQTLGFSGGILQSCMLCYYYCRSSHFNSSTEETLVGAHRLCRLKQNKSDKTFSRLCNIDTLCSESHCWRPETLPDFAGSDLENSFSPCHIMWSQPLTLTLPGWVTVPRHVMKGKSSGRDKCSCHAGIFHARMLCCATLAP